MEEEEVVAEKTINFPLTNPILWLTKFITLQADIFYNSAVAIFSPFLSLLSLLFYSFHRTTEEDPKEGDEDNVELTVNVEARVPSKVVQGSSQLIKKVGLGLLAAVYVCMVLTVLLVVSFLLGVGLVRLWVEEPVILTEGLQFDYSQVHPEAVFSFVDDCGSECPSLKHANKKKVQGVPVGHTFYVSLVLLVPESDYNREIGVFQLTAELISSNGGIMARSSHPCMLQFRSWPIRYMKTIFMGIPLLLGITAETQTIKIPMIKHKEGFPRTEAIRITLNPRAGTDYLPQLYEAELLLNSQLPWRKELVYRWKWTFYIWTSMYLYTILLIILLCCFRPVILPVITESSGNHSQLYSVVEAAEKPEARSRAETDVTESLKRWQQSRIRRLHHREIQMPEPGGACASSINLTREDTGATLEEDTGDSESVCYGGLNE